MEIILMSGLVVLGFIYVWSELNSCMYQSDTVIMTLIADLKDTQLRLSRGELYDKRQI